MGRLGGPGLGNPSLGGPSLEGFGDVGLRGPSLEGPILGVPISRDVPLWEGPFGGGVPRFCRCPVRESPIWGGGPVLGAVSFLGGLSPFWGVPFWGDPVWESHLFFGGVHFLRGVFL